MQKKHRTILRFGGLGVILVAVLGVLPGYWALGAGVVGAVMFLAAGPA